MKQYKPRPYDCYAGEEKLGQEYTDTVFQELESGPDRVVAIVGCCLLDDLLYEFVKDHAIPMEACNKEAYKKLFSPGSHYLTASARNIWLHCMGHYGKVTFKNIERIQKIRNMFAHSITDVAANHARLTFDSKEVVDQISKLDFYSKLEIPYPPNPGNLYKCEPKVIYINEVVAIARLLTVTRDHYVEEDRSFPTMPLP